LDIGVPFRDLGPVDMAALAEKTLAQKVHSVMNRGKQPRISFIFDYFPPPAARGARRSLRQHASRPLARRLAVAPDGHAVDEHFLDPDWERSR
jgi:hypothetical protein